MSETPQFGMLLRGLKLPTSARLATAAWGLGFTFRGLQVGLGVYAGHLGVTKSGRFRVQASALKICHKF